jgi:hypothetical protein
MDKVDKKLKEMIKKHNKYVKDEFKKAEKGEVICLTDMMISKEKIDKVRGY